ncbi:MAG: glycoside hydrolase family 127 protein [Bacteroidaceae bacterium]|nr:glycoside hydrolase family 127 protein [Bacteroidaceae bacterium]
MRLRNILLAGVLTLTALGQTNAQREIYPKHFDLEQVTLLDGPMKTAMDLNIQMLMQYDVDRLLSPFVRQAGLSSTTNTSSPYYQWLTKHPIFPNWGDSSFDLSGHVGGHYLSALALAYAACRDNQTRDQLKERMDYMLKVMKDCQDQYDQNTEGLYGFLGGQPINDDWKALYKGDLSAIQNHWGWVPFYCQHKVLAGLRDAYLYGNSEVAKEMFRKLSDWSVNLVAKVSDDAFEGFLNCEHGGMNESMLDAYQLFGDKKYLTAAKKYTHKAMLNGMQTLNKTFLDGKHANTQVPKFIGMERIYEQSSTSTTYRKAAENFWTDVAQNRTVCIGGNSVGEHFLSVANSNRYIDNLDGPESCNTNNMLKLSEMMSDRTGDAKYADFYEKAMWNHILSTQDPTTGGYVYFTTLRPQGYRIYSQPNQGMWCCVGTGMENHSKYGHFIYTHDGSETLYVNLFTPSKLESDEFIVTQETQFPYSNTTTLTIGKAGHYTVALRHPAWAGEGFALAVNGSPVDITVEKGKASYVKETRDWQVGDKITLTLPMEVRYEECPNYGDYIAFSYGPILLGAQTTAVSQQEAEATGLVYEKLQNEYAGAGRMDHAPGAMGSSKNLLYAPLLIGERANVLSRIQPVDLSKLQFTIDASREGVETYKWQNLTLVPFYSIHHSRYMCYWYQQTAENFANSSMAKTEAENEALQARTLDFVAPGEQQSEAGHEYKYSSDSNKGVYNGESYRDAQSGGYVQYALYNKEGITDSLAIMCRFTTADKGRKATLLVDGKKIADIVIPESVKNADSNGFFNIEYPIPDNLLTKNGAAKEKFIVRLSANAGTLNPGLYYLRLVKGYNANANAYQFRAQDWTTGDANRISANNITYDLERNVIKAKSTGANNIALMLKYQELDYDIDKAQKFLVVRGSNLSTTDGNSYLWWLNGANQGSQVKPTTVKTITVDGSKQTLVAWNMTTSGLYGNFTGDRPSICMGQTIFGLTSSKSDGSCEIHDINFVASVNDYINTTTMVASALSPMSSTTAYDLTGRRLQGRPQRGSLYIQNQTKRLAH